MQVQTAQPTRAMVMPTNAPHVVQQRTPWPFPAGRALRKTDSVAKAAKAVISTTARACLIQELIGRDQIMKGKE